MRMDVEAGLEWAGEPETGDGRGTPPLIVTFVDRRGRTGLVAFGRRIRRYAGSDYAAEGHPARDPAYTAATIH